MRVAVVGAGIAGLSCGAFLSVDNEVVVFDEGRSPGGRTTSRKVGAARFDAGAPWFEAKSDAFKTTLAGWQQLRVASPYAPVFSDDSEKPEGELWVGVPGMNAIARELSGMVQLRWSTPVSRVERVDEGFKLFGRGEPLGVFERVVCAVSATDAKELVRASGLDGAVFETVKTESVWAATVEWSAPAKASWSAGRWRKGMLEAAVKESGKPERDPGERWVVYGSSEWSIERATAKAADVATQLAEELGRRIEADGAPSARAFQWLDAHVKTPAGRATIELGGVLFCGDWCAGGGVEGAWKSGMLTAQKVARGD